MTPLTESMTRLRNEILAARRDRETLRVELRRTSGARHAQVQVWRAALLGDLAGVRRVWAEIRGKSATAPPPPPVETVAQELEPEAAKPVRALASEPAVAPAAATNVPQAAVVAAETVAPAAPASPVPKVHDVPAEVIAPAAAGRVPQTRVVAAETVPPAVPAINVPQVHAVATETVPPAVPATNVPKAQPPATQSAPTVPARRVPKTKPAPASRVPGVHDVAAETAPLEPPALTETPPGTIREPSRRPGANRPRPFLFWRVGSETHGQRRP